MTAPQYEPPDRARGEWTRAEKVAWVKHRASQEPWTVAISSVVQDMDLMGIPLSEDVAALGMGEAIVGGEAGVRRWIEGIQ